MKRIITLLLLFTSFFSSAQVRSLIGSDTVSLSTRINSIDVFIIAGQSNALPQGDSALSPKPKEGTAYKFTDNVISYATDPVGTTASGTGSPWPSFAIKYYSLTGRKICFVQTAVSGSSMHQASEPNSLTWDVNGTLYTASVNTTTAALDSIRNRGFSPVLKGVLWHQGEKDANNINSAATTVAQYKSALRALIYRYRASFSDSIGFYIFRTGTDLSASDVGFAAVRQAEEDVADSMYNTVIVFRGMLDFSARGMLDDDVHVNQSGANETGYYGAIGTVNGDEGQIYKVQYIEAGSNTAMFPVARFGRNGVLTTTPKALQFEPINDGIYYTDTVAGVVTRRKLAAVSGTTFSGFTTSGSIVISGAVNIGTNAAPLTDLFTTNVKGATGSNLIIQSNAGTNAVVFRRSTTEDFRQAASTGNILIGTTTDIASSRLTVASTTQGFLPPRMTATQASAISSPAQGLLLFVTDTNGTFTSVGWWGYNGSAWEKLNN